MGGISLQTTKRIIPMIYAYSTPEIKRHEGWLKIGYTANQSVEDRVKQQGHTVDVVQKIEWKGNAIFDDGSGDTFTDHDFRNYLKKLPTCLQQQDHVQVQRIQSMYGDWIDPEIIDFMNDVLEKENCPKRLHLLPAMDQIAVLVYCTEEQSAALDALIQG